MSNHIMAEDWILFFAGKMSLPDKLHILRHCAECAECRMILQSSDNLRFALKNLTANKQTASHDDSAFRAIAGVDGPVTSTKTNGYLSFRLIKTNSGYTFADEEPIAGGFGERYAMNRSADGLRFEEDGGAFLVEIDGNQLVIRLIEQGVLASVHLVMEGRENPPERLWDHLIINLPTDGYCTLEILFGEV